VRTDQKAHKNSQIASVFFVLLGSSSVKAVCKHVGEIDPSRSLSLSLSRPFS